MIEYCTRVTCDRCGHSDVLSGDATSAGWTEINVRTREPLKLPERGRVQRDGMLISYMLNLCPACVSAFEERLQLEVVK